MDMRKSDSGNTCISGEWVRFSGFETEISEIALYSNGTAEISQIAFTWRYSESAWDNATDGDFHIEIFDNSGELYTKAKFYLSSVNGEFDGTYVLQIQGDCYCNKKDYKIVEITKENFWEYFKAEQLILVYKNRSKARKNSIECYVYLVLKDNLLADKNKSSLDYECTWKNEQRVLEYCAVKGSFNISDAIYTYFEKGAKIGEFEIFSRKLFAVLGDARVRRISNRAAESGAVKYLVDWYPGDIKIKNVMGTLYLYNN